MQDLDDIRGELERLADELAEHVVAVRRQCEELAELLETASPADPAGSHEAEVDDRAPIRSIAIEMALAGRTREEVSSHIRDVYGIEADPDVLDNVFERRAG